MKLLIGGSPCTHWRPISGYEGFYEVSDNGEVRNSRTGRILKQKVERNGYVRVHLSKDGTARSMLLHRVVANTFLPNPNGLLTVNHLDEDKTNNRLSNLEWANMSRQNSYGQGARARNKAKERPVWQLSMDGEPIHLWSSITFAQSLYESGPSRMTRRTRTMTASNTASIRRTERA